VKIKIIKDCGKCENNYPIYSGKEADIAFYVCIVGKTYGEIKNYPEIPEWCPLPDYKESDHENPN